MEIQMTPVVYSCGHSVNILSPGVSDPQGLLGEGFRATGTPAHWDKKCWTCDPDAAYLKQTPPEVTEALRKAKKGED